MLYAENKDIKNITTSVNMEKLYHLLKQYKYDTDKAQYLYNAFRFGFSLNYQGNLFGKK